MRNVALALGNALRVERDAVTRDALRAALNRHADHPSETVREQVAWSLNLETAVDRLMLSSRQHED